MPVRFRARAAFIAPSLAAPLLVVPLSLSSHHSVATVPALIGVGATLADCGPTWIEVTQLPPINGPTKLKLAVVWYRRSGRYFRARARYDAKAVATYGCCRLLQIAGDIELNPGPGKTRTQPQERLHFSALLYHAQSLRGKLGKTRVNSGKLG